MDKIKVITNEVLGEVIETVLIDRGNGEYTSMLKLTYEEQQSANDANEL